MAMIIETDRLRLRPYDDADAERVLDIRSRMDVIRWLDNPPWVPMASIEEALEWVAKSRRWDGPFPVVRAIEVRGTAEVAGTVLIAPMERIEGGFVGEYEVGWHLHPDCTGRGYATEAATALLDNAFGAGLEHVWCDMFPDNEPSASVALRLGLPDHGIQPDPWYGDQSRMFSCTAEEWALRDCVRTAPR